MYLYQFNLRKIDTASAQYNKNTLTFNYFALQRYLVSMDFIEKYEEACGCLGSVKRLRAHPSYNTFLSKWSLPVYFQIRFQEIAGAFEGSLSAPIEPTKSECEIEILSKCAMLQFIKNNEKHCAVSLLLVAKLTKSNDRQRKRSY